MFPILAAGEPADAATLPAFLVARDGVYLRKRTLLGESQTKVSRVAHLPAEREEIDYALPAVPADVMARAVGFFRAVYRAHRTEAAALLLWRDGSFDLAVPRQRVSTATVKFKVGAADLPARLAPGRDDPLARGLRRLRELDRRGRRGGARRAPRRRGRLRPAQPRLRGRGRRRRRPLPAPTLPGSSSGPGGSPSRPPSGSGG